VWRDDRALVSRPDSAQFAAWFERNAFDGSMPTDIDAPSLGCIDDIADEARLRAESWAQFALLLESRVRTGHAVNA
jgi:hypothetical protein